MDLDAFAHELLDAFNTGQIIPLSPSTRDPAFDLESAYAVEASFARLRTASGRITNGRKVGYANKAMWRILKLETLVWAHMYDDTVQYAAGNDATFSLAKLRAPKIEPEIVFKLKQPVTAANTDAAGALASAEWMAAGFEIIDCPFPDWQFKPVDFVAAYGLHAGLVIGEPVAIEEERIPSLVGELAGFKLKVLKNGQVIEEGSGKNSLRSPALCLAELAAAAQRQAPVEPLAPGELISTGTLTTAPLIGPGDIWRVDFDGLSLPSLTLRLS
jgi:2-oxo-3-hexenedioate decarboxylase